MLAGTRALVGGLRAPAPSQFPCDESSPVGSTPLECAMDKLQRTQEQLDEARAEAARLKAAAAGQQQEQPPAAKQQEQGAAAEQDASRWEGWEAELKLGEGEARKEAQATAEAELAEVRDKSPLG